MMSRSLLSIIMILFHSLVLSCGQEQAGEERREELADTVIENTANSRLSRYNLQEEDPSTFKVSRKLSEISGLAVTQSGRLFAHDDEDPVVYELDRITGEILKQFTVGSGFMAEDFEGIAAKGDTLFLVNSGGDLFEFLEADDRQHAQFKLYRTSLSTKNDVEGLEYDPMTDCLLLACKGDPGEGYIGFRAVYEFSLKTRSLSPSPRFLIRRDVSGLKTRKKNFNPSGIALVEQTGTFFIISADAGLIVEIDRQGDVLGYKEIPRDTNSQPEGIAFLPDGSLLLANDGQGGKGTITRYPQVGP